MDVLVRGIPDDVHADLVRRAADRGTSLRSYLVETLTHHVSVPSMADWLRQVGDLEPIPGGDLTGPELIAAGRIEDDELYGR